MAKAQRLGNPHKKELIDKLQESDDHQGSDFAKAQLSAVNLSKKDFSKSNFTGANLSGASLANCNLSSCDLTDTLLTGTQLTGADLTGAKRKGKQILKHASIEVGTKHYYAFLCQTKKTKIVLINEQYKPEYEFKRGTATTMGAMLYNLLMMEQ